jgi:hypothetical protein
MGVVETPSVFSRDSLVFGMRVSSLGLRIAQPSGIWVGLLLTE